MALNIQQAREWLARPKPKLIVVGERASIAEVELPKSIVPCWNGYKPGHGAGLPRRSYKLHHFQAGSAMLLDESAEPFRYQISWMHATVKGEAKTLCGLSTPVTIEPDEFHDRQQEGIAWCGFCQPMMSLMLGSTCCGRGEGERMAFTIRQRMQAEMIAQRKAQLIVPGS